MDKLLKTLAAVLALASLALANEHRTCYQCSSETDDDVGDHCTWEDPDLDHMNEIRMADAEHMCVMCYKEHVDGDLVHVHRGCLDKDTYEAWHDNYGFSEDHHHECHTDGDDERCVCSHDHCNGAGSFVISMTTLTLAIAHKVFA